MREDLIRFLNKNELYSYNDNLSPRSSRDTSLSFKFSLHDKIEFSKSGNSFWESGSIIMLHSDHTYDIINDHGVKVYRIPDKFIRKFGTTSSYPSKSRLSDID